jgi:hypothetical protein
LTADARACGFGKSGKAGMFTIYARLLDDPSLSGIALARPKY